MLGLHVSPDLDSMLYALAGLADEERGWGRAGETWRALETVAELGGEAWFSLGDRDLGLHLVRTQLLREGAPLSEVTARLARRWGSSARSCRRPTTRCARSSRRPAGRSRSRPGSSHAAIATRSTRSTTRARPRRRRPRVSSRRCAAADLIVIAPSNPYVSIGPILAVDEIREALVPRTRAVRRGQPAGRRPRGQGPGRPDAAAARRRDVASARRALLRRA